MQVTTGVSAVLTYLGQTRQLAGDDEAAERFASEALAANCNTGNRRAIANSTLLLAGIARERGQHRAAGRHYVKAFDLAREVGAAQLLAAHDRIESAMTVLAVVIAHDQSSGDIVTQAKDAFAELTELNAPETVVKARERKVSYTLWASGRYPRAACSSRMR